MREVYLEVVVDPVTLDFVAVDPVDHIVRVNFDDSVLLELCVMLVKLSFLTRISSDHNFSVLLNSILQSIIHRFYHPG